MTPKKHSGPRRAVGVVRISKDRKNETSTDSQETSIRAYCQAHGIDVVDVVVDKGRSAYKSSRDTRPGLRRARSLINSGAADVLVCWKLDRVARNTRDLLNLVADLTDHGCDFVSVTENFDTTTPLGRAMLTIIAALAELESAQKSERVSEWQDRRRAKGAPPTGPRPYGYDRGGEDNPNELHINRAEAKVIRTVAMDILAGGSVRAALRAINAAGGRSDGRPLTHRGLVRILTSPTIAALRPETGTVVEWYDGGQTGALVACNAWKPILNREIWEKLHEILLDPARRTNHSIGRRWLLSGLLECGKCGMPMRIKPAHAKGPRYECPTEHLSIPARDTDRVIERLIFDSLDLAAWRRLRSQGTRPVSTIEMERQLTDLVDQFERQEISYDEWKGMRAALMSRMTTAASEPLALPMVDDPVKAWPSLGVEARRLIVAAVLPTITIGPAQLGLSRFDESRVIVPAVQAGEAAA